MDLTALTALELGAALRRGDISPVQAVQAGLDAIAARDNVLNCFLTVTGAEALERARRMGAASAESPLSGVPMAFKDNLCTRGVKTSCASRILGDFTPPYSAAAAERLERAGALSLGKLNMDEFAMGSTSETSCYGPVRNPWDSTRVAGGSSGGAAAAVAAGEVWYAVGSDTGGSIRQPAAYCGVTGMKPTYGTVSRYGLIAYASSLDQVGPIARSAADCAAVLDALAGQDSRDSTCLAVEGQFLARLTGDGKGLRIGLPVQCFGEGLDPQVRAAVLDAAAVFRALGAQVEECSIPLLACGVSAYYILACAEASSNLARFDGVRYGRRAEGCRDLAGLYTQTRSQGFGAEVKRRILLGTFVLSAGFYDAYYKKALQVRAMLKAAYDAAFQRYDLLLTPVTPSAAPRLGESLTDPLQMYQSDVYTVPVNLAGLPGLSMPCGFTASGLPIGVQLAGPPLGDQTVLSAAHAFQQATNYHRRRPGRGGAL